jgi:hypothetical protein
MEDHEPQTQVIQYNSESVQQSTHGAQHDHISQLVFTGDRLHGEGITGSTDPTRAGQGQELELLTCHDPSSAPWVAS